MLSPNLVKSKITYVQSFAENYLSFFHGKEEAIFFLHFKGIWPFCTAMKVNSLKVNSCFYLKARFKQYNHGEQSRLVK